MFFTYYNSGTSSHVVTVKLSGKLGGLCVSVAVGDGPVGKLEGVGEGLFPGARFLGRLFGVSWKSPVWS